jgi:hypothetical protein
VRGRHADRCATGDPRAGAVAVVEPVPLQHSCLEHREAGRPAEERVLLEAPVDRSDQCMTVM